MVDRRRDLEDLVGGDDEGPEEKLSFRSQDVYLLKSGVSVQWLAKAFGMTRHIVEKKLKECPPLSTGSYGNPLYDLPKAASYLVEPNLDIKKYLETAKPDSLPERLRETVWNSKLKRQRWEERAQHLWRTEVVIAKFSKILEDIRMHVQLIPDRLERESGLDLTQYKLVRDIVDEIQNEMYDNILELAKDTAVYNQMIEEGLGDDELPSKPKKRPRRGEDLI